MEAADPLLWNVIDFTAVSGVFVPTEPIKNLCVELLIHRIRASALDGEALSQIPVCFQNLVVHCIEIPIDSRLIRNLASVPATARKRCKQHASVSLFPFDRNFHTVIHCKSSTDAHLFTDREITGT